MTNRTLASYQVLTTVVRRVTQRLGGYMKTYFAILIPSVITFAAIGCGNSTSALPASRAAHPSHVAQPPNISAAVRASIEARIAAARPDDGPELGPVVVGVFSNGETLYFARGNLPSSSTPVNRDTLFKVCSLTKVFTGVLLADAVVQGRMRLTDEVQAYLPHLKIPRHAGGAIQLQHLATYSAGFPWQPTNFKSKTEGGYSQEAWRSFLQEFSPPYAPGEGFRYGNAGFALLGDALSESAKMPLRILFEARIFAPLEMKRSGFIGERINDTNRAQGFDEDGKRVELDRDEASQPAACALETSASDLMSFVRAHFMEATTPLSRAMHLAIQRQRAAKGDFEGFDVGLGWFLDADGRPSKSGAIAGYRSGVSLDLPHRTGVVVLAADERIDQGLIVEGALFDLARTEDDAPRILERLPPSATPYDVTYDDGLTLVGIEAPAEVALGDHAYVRYFYRVDRSPRYEWRAFVHADAKGERVRSNHVFPVAMRSMTPGTIIEDRVNLHFRQDLKNTTFKLYSGFYRRDLRMPFEPATSDGRVLGPSIRVVAAKHAASL